MIYLLERYVNLNNTYIAARFVVFFSKDATSRFYFYKICMYTLHRTLQTSV